MDVVYVKLRQKEKNKFRKMISTDEPIYKDLSIMISSSTKYSPETILDKDEWFFIEEAKKQAYSESILNISKEPIDYDSLERKDFDKVDFLMVMSSQNIFFQNVSKTRLISKKSIVSFGGSFEYRKNQQEITLNEAPDAVYVSTEDRLYFRKLESITSIFKGIDLLYREATDDEVSSFLDNKFISLQGDYSTASVKTANRKRIALAKKTLESLNAEDQNKIFSYITEYCPDLKTNQNAFEIGTEEEMKLLLYGIEQRFYTTPVGGEKRLANSIIAL